MKQGKIVSGEDIEVNWKKLYEDGKYAWIALVIIFTLLTSLIGYLLLNGYFTAVKTNTDKIELVKIVGIRNYFGPRVTIAGAVTNYAPLEVTLPTNCAIPSSWVGKEVEITVITKYRPYNKSEYFEYPGLYMLCEKNVSAS